MILGYIDPGTGITVTAGVGGVLIAFLLGFLGIVAANLKKGFKFFEKRKWMTVIILITVIIVVLAIIGVLMSRDISDFKEKVIILGFDGLSPGIVESMMERGELPNFSRLKGSGAYRHLQTTNPPQSPVAWSSFATGQNAGRHGVFNFIGRDPGTYNLSISLADIAGETPRRVIKSKCFWNYASEKRVPVVLIGHPMTFPPDKVYGKMLSGMGVPDMLGTEGTFTFYTSEDAGKNKGTGGKVFHIKKSSEFSINLIGPRLDLGGKVDNVKVPVRVKLKCDDKIILEYQNKSREIGVGSWSGWQDVEFKLGLLKRSKGIFRFYLVETEPEFKLYISPINLDPRDPFFQISHPKGYSGKLADEIGLYYTMGMPMDTWAVTEGRLGEEPFLEQVEMVLRDKKKILDLELGRLEKGIFYCYFESPDIIQHMFWRYIDKENPLYEESAPQKYKDMIFEWYKKLDLVLGDVMEKIDADKDTLMVVSDHGFGTFKRSAHINSWLRENGYFMLEDRHAKSGGELLRGIDWSATRAYSIGFGAIYINQKGREGRGIVDPGRETERLKDEISAKMKQWTDGQNGQKIVNNMYPREEIFWGDHADEAPDLYVGFNLGYRASWQTALGAAPASLIEDNLKKWSGTHLCDPSLVPGIIFCNKEIVKKEPYIYDITPTIMSIIGFESDEIERCRLDGRPLF